MPIEQVALDLDNVRDVFDHWSREQDDLDARLGESLAALEAYQSHLDAWQKDLARQREQLEQQRAEFEQRREQWEQEQTQREQELVEQLAQQVQEQAVQQSSQGEPDEPADQPASDPVPGQQTATVAIPEEGTSVEDPVLRSVVAQFDKIRQQLARGRNQRNRS